MLFPLMDDFNLRNEFILCLLFFFLKRKKSCYANQGRFIFELVVVIIEEIQKLEENDFLPFIRFKKNISTTTITKNEIYDM